MRFLLGPIRNESGVGAWAVTLGLSAASGVMGGECVLKHHKEGLSGAVCRGQAPPRPLLPVLPLVATTWGSSSEARKGLGT